MKEAMMDLKTITLVPLVGIEIEDVGKISFGMSRENVKNVLGIPSYIREKSIYYDDIELRIDLSDNENVCYIECIGGPFCEYSKPMIYGHNVFTLEGKELVSLLTKENNGYIEKDNTGCSYTFRNICVGIWMSFCQEQIEAGIKEAILDEIDNEYIENMKSDLEKSKYFWTIGIGEKKYYV